jgi:hypothetical protein
LSVAIGNIERGIELSTLCPISTAPGAACGTGLKSCVQVFVILFVFGLDVLSITVATFFACKLKRDIVD